MLAQRSLFLLEFNNHPSAPLRNGLFLLMAQAPLLEKEGNGAPNHTHIHLAESSQSARPLLWGAHEILCVVRAAGPIPFCNLGVWTQRPRHIHFASACSGGVDLIGCDSFLAPLFESREVIGTIRTDSAATMADSREEEQAHPVIGLSGLLNDL